MWCTSKWLYAYVYTIAKKSAKRSSEMNYNRIHAAVNLNLMSSDMKNFLPISLKTQKTKVEAFIFTKMKHTPIAVSPIGN